MSKISEKKPLCKISKKTGSKIRRYRLQKLEEDIKVKLLRIREEIIKIGQTIKQQDIINQKKLRKIATTFLQLSAEAENLFKRQKLLL